MISFEQVWYTAYIHAARSNVCKIQTDNNEQSKKVEVYVSDDYGDEQ